MVERARYRDVCAMQALTAIRRFTGKPMAFYCAQVISVAAEFSKGISKRRRDDPLSIQVWLHQRSSLKAMFAFKAAQNRQPIRKACDPP